MSFNKNSIKNSNGACLLLEKWAKLSLDANSLFEKFVSLVTSFSFLKSQAMLATYKHQDAKYIGLNPRNQTPKKYVVGQKYKVGTGIILVQVDSEKTSKITISKSNYKGFLSYILANQLRLGDVVGFKWIPRRVAKEETIAVQECDFPCIKGSGCVKPGCICNEDKEMCE